MDYCELIMYMYYYYYYYYYSSENTVICSQLESQEKLTSRLPLHKAPRTLIQNILSEILHVIITIPKNVTYTFSFGIGPLFHVKLFA